LIRAWSSSTVKSATFISPTFDFENSDFLVGKSTKGRKRWNHCVKSRLRPCHATSTMMMPGNQSAQTRLIVKLRDTSRHAFPYRPRSAVSELATQSPSAHRLRSTRTC
jgi:hypothetical protein